MIAILLILFVPLSPLNPAQVVVTIEFPSMAHCEAVIATGKISADGVRLATVACVPVEGTPT